MSFEQQLSGGHHNSLGNTVEVVKQVLKDENRITELLSCYKSPDELVRMRVSNALKRIFREKPEWFKEYKDVLFDHITQVLQPSAQWTFVQIFSECSDQLTESELERTKLITLTYLNESDDWIVLNHSMKAMENWIKDDENCRTQCRKVLMRLRKDNRKSVSSRAIKLLDSLPT